MRHAHRLAVIAGLAALLSCPPSVQASADAGPNVPVRVGSHEGYGRVVFDTPARTDYRLTQQDQHVVVQFGGDLTIASVSRLPHNVLAITITGTQAELVIAPETVVRDWRFGDRIVIDVWDQKAAPQSPRAVPRAAGSQPGSPPSGSPQQAATSPAQPSPSKPDEATRPIKPEPAHAEPPPGAAPVPVPAPVQPPQPGPAATPTPHASDAPTPAPGQEVAPAPSPAAPADTAEQTKPVPDSVLIVPLDAQTGVAAFRRENAALIVFDQPRTIDMDALRDDPVFGAATVQTLSTATVIHIRLAPSKALSVLRTPSAWRIVVVPSEPKLQPLTTTLTDDRLVLTAAAPGSVVSVSDPDTGATLLVGTQRREGQGMPVLRRSAEFILLPTWQGIAIEPNADTLTLRPSQEGFLLTGGPRGLTLSPPSDIADQLAHAIGLTRRIDFPSQPTDTLMQRLRRQVAEDAATPVLGRGPPRQEVARTMISLGLGVEAQSVLRMAAADDPHAAASPDNAVLGSIAALLAFRPQEAEGVNDARLAPSDDLALWRALRLAELQDGSPQAAAVLAATLPLLLAYPPEMRDRMLPLAAETLITGGELGTAAALLDSRKDDAALDLARGMLREAQGNWTDALGIYDRLLQSKDPLQRARAAVRGVELRLAKGTLTVRQAADQLDKFLYAWRGDQRERALRERLAELRAKSGSWRSALALLRETEGLFGQDKAAIHAELQDMFTALFRENAADALAPLELVSLVEENTDLLPDGADGEALEARLADRLLTLDLPKRAGPVLEKLMQAAPTGTGRANFGARLATLRLREGDPAGALVVLTASDVADLPADVAERRILLKAAAHARQGDNERALAALSPLKTAAADEARATILERANDWPGAQGALTAYVAKTVPPDGQLDDTQRRSLLRLATAAARSGDETTLTTLREKERSRMASGPLADMFRLLTADQVRSVADLKRSGQETALARALPSQLKALQPTGQPSP